MINGVKRVLNQKALGAQRAEFFPEAAAINRSSQPNDLQPQNFVLIKIKYVLSSFIYPINLL